MTKVQSKAQPKDLSLFLGCIARVAIELNYGITPEDLTVGGADVIIWGAVDSGNFAFEKGHLSISFWLGGSMPLKVYCFLLLPGRVGHILKLSAFPSLTLTVVIAIASYDLGRELLSRTWSWADNAWNLELLYKPSLANLIYYSSPDKNSPFSSKRLVFL